MIVLVYIWWWFLVGFWMLRIVIYRLFILRCFRCWGVWWFWLLLVVTMTIASIIIGLSSWWGSWMGCRFMSGGGVSICCSGCCYLCYWCFYCCSYSFWLSPVDVILSIYHYYYYSHFIPQDHAYQQTLRRTQIWEQSSFFYQLARLNSHASV